MSLRPSVRCVAQTLRPSKWIIVDDGSSDRTPQIVDAAAGEHDWIQVIHRADRGFRKPGTGVMEAFVEGYAQISNILLGFPGETRRRSLLCP